MSKVLVFLAPGFEEIEAVSIIDILRRAKINVTVAGLTATIIEGAHGIKIVPDESVDSVSSKDYTAIVCPGGSPGYKNLRNDKRVIKIIKTANQENKLIAAICAAPTVLSDANVLQNKNCTIYPGMENELIKGGGTPKPDNVVVDGNIVTSKGPATALEFALKLTEILAGKQAAEAVARNVLVDTKC